MAYQMTISQKPSYLHAVVTGQNSRESVARYLEELLFECATRGCYRVLIEERLEGPRLEATDVFEIAAQGSRQAMCRMQAVAYVDVHAHVQSSLMAFAGTVAANRGMPVAVFLTVAEAEKWLRAENQPANPAADSAAGKL